MNIALLAVDSTYPNLALMKIARYHLEQGDRVFWYDMFEDFDKLYISKIFTFTPDYQFSLPNVQEVLRGGTGYDLTTTLPKEIDCLQPYYDIYPNIPKNLAYGFLTRGCPNKCKWCVVPKKEGNIKPYMDIEEIAIEGRNHIILMDNNILASDYGLMQIEKIIKLGLRVDFNQALDARLVTDDIAKLLAKVKWLNLIRFGCDTAAQIEDCERATSLIEKHGYNGEFFYYCMLHGDFLECFNRVEHWRVKGTKYYAFAQPFRDINNKRQIIPQWQKDLASWVDKKWTYRSCEFKDFMPRKGFRCEKYFKEYKL